MKKTREKYFRHNIFGIIMLLCQISYAQMSEDFSFLGILQTTDRQVMTYKIDLTIKEGKVSGTSLMDLNGPNATTSSISGTYNYKTNILSYAEDKVLSSKAPLDGDFCFISVKAKMMVKMKKSHLKGTFWGLVDKKDSCAIGDINMVATSYVINKMAIIEKVIKKTGTKDSATLANADLESFKTSINTQRISSVESVSVSVNSGKCLLKLWDDGIEDGDMVNVKLNGTLVLHNYTLKKDAKVIGLTLQKGENTIELVALNTGERFPNTAFLSVEDTISKTKLSSNLEKDQTAVIKVVY